MSGALLTMSGLAMRFSEVRISTDTEIFFVQNVLYQAITTFRVNANQLVGRLWLADRGGQVINLSAPDTRSRRQEAKQIVRRVMPWSGSVREAFVWYRHQPIPAFGNQTAKKIVENGGSEHLMSYLDGISVGGYS